VVSGGTPSRAHDRGGERKVIFAVPNRVGELSYLAVGGNSDHENGFSSAQLLVVAGPLWAESAMPAAGRCVVGVLVLTGLIGAWGWVSPPPSRLQTAYCDSQTFVGSIA
jgi:hypothetical protein